MIGIYLYSPSDVDDAHSRWGANCGPCSLAALLSLDVDAVRRWFPTFADRPWVNPTQMKAALDAAGVCQHTLAGNCWPTSGLAFVQIDGPWCKPGVPIGAAYRHTHWVAVRTLGAQVAVYDANARCWMLRADWEADMVPLVLADTPKATGWWVRTGIEVEVATP